MITVRKVKQRITQWFAQETFQANTKSFKALFPRKAKITCVASGLQFTEGPVWIAEAQCLRFSDIPANRIYQLTTDGQLTVFREPSDHANGLTRDRIGRLIACEHGSRRVTRTELDGTITVLCDRFDDRALNSPNDVIVKRDGTIYFTDPPYGIQPEQQEQPCQGVYQLSPNGQLRLIADDFDRPNGLALSPDEQTLYIGDSSKRCHIRAFDVLPDGAIANGRVFYDMTIPGVTGRPDGMKIDQAGRLYATGPGGIWIFEPNGTHLGTIQFPEQPANCAWGDADWQSLYVTAQTSVYKLRVNTPGV
ncbi:SMP-30/gluconolactonase/LRE family protein [Leptolyngbya boryana CZ1]|uniref:SMP-30/gluconolactonase/LRE family protein n=1 Tax=Leptolyngbya boryana CZ1 TaxID=3060204 RepID=A0AA97AZA9_LEPBY|nr:SMP-30/gluconolactonase/LRE family protein [Leptolyngbya boryana]WNZ49181.1 SMP-30/gluconolactonase/LRE family protein [Leptolyngbya boryana CZ1]